MFFHAVRRYAVAALAAIFIVIAFWFWHALRPVDAVATAPVAFPVVSGDGFGAIADHLAARGLVRSAFAFKLLLVLEGSASSLQPGLYRLNPAMSAWAIARTVASNDGRSVSVTIPEGSNMFEIDRALSEALVVSPGDFVRAAGAAGLEGRLFPDTYEFTNGERMSDILKAFADDFHKKAEPLFAEHSAVETSTLIIASMLEKEAPNPTDERLIAGIVEKRLAAGMTLNIDAAVCYGKQIAHPTSVIDCALLTKADFGLDSPYNTYLHRGLPPTPIGNPGVSSIEAALAPTPSPYWFYLSDPASGKIIYARTLDEQNRNIAKYLK